MPLGELGPPIDPEALAYLDVPEPELRAADAVAAATMLYVDSFGNIALNVTREHLEAIGCARGARVELELGGERYFATAARTFGDAREGDVILYEDSYRNMSIAINRGSAADLLHAVAGREVTIRVLDTGIL